MRKLLLSGLTGMIFGLGIAISGMANPAKVLNFFDVAGSWDPSLIFVMGGALITTVLRPGHQHHQLCRQGPGLQRLRRRRFSVMDIDYAAGRITYDHADEIIAYVKARRA
jgi:hypothetical protein